MSREQPSEVYKAPLISLINLLMHVNDLPELPRLLYSMHVMAQDIEPMIATNCSWLVMHYSNGLKSGNMLSCVIQIMLRLEPSW